MYSSSMEEYTDMTLSHKGIIHTFRKNQYITDIFNICQTHEMGGCILVCDNCGNRVVKYYPCNKRGCWKCAPINQRRWEEKTKRKVLPTGHFHQVFKVPTELFYHVWQRDEKKFIGTMFRAVQRAYKEEAKQTGLTPGIIMVFQSHGELLSVQLHIHCMVSMGGTTERGKWIPIHKMNEMRLEENYRKFFYEEVSKRYKGFFWDTLRPILLEAKTEKAELYTTYHRRSANAIIHYVSKSLCGLIVHPDDLKYDRENDIAIIHNRKKGAEDKLDAEEFVRRYAEHIPMDGEVLVRHYGLYSNCLKEIKEGIRKDVFHEELKEEEEMEELCPECKSHLRMDKEFTPDRLPLEIRLALNKGFPPKHGTVLAA